MPKRRKQINAVFAAAAAAATGVGVGLAGPAGVAHASNGKWQPKINGTAVSKTSFVASNSTAAILGTSGALVELSCPPGFASATGMVFSAPVSPAPAQIGSISQANFGTGTRGKCNIISTGGTVITSNVISATLNHAAKLFASSSRSGIVHGKITSISAHISASTITGCFGTVTGSLKASYSNAHNTLIVDPSRSLGLHVESADGSTGSGAMACEGALIVSHKAFFTGAFHVITPSGLTIVDP